MSSFASVAKLSLGLFCLFSSASAAAINQVAPRATSTSPYPSGFPYVLGSVGTASASDGGACTATLSVSYNAAAASSFWDCGRHTYASTVYSTYSLDCGACDAVSASYNFPAGGCPMGPTYTVSTVTETPTTVWTLGCAAATPTGDATTSACGAPTTTVA